MQRAEIFVLLQTLSKLQLGEEEGLPSIERPLHIEGHPKTQGCCYSCPCHCRACVQQMDPNTTFLCCWNITVAVMVPSGAVVIVVSKLLTPSPELRASWVCRCHDNQAHFVLGMAPLSSGFLDAMFLHESIYILRTAFRARWALQIKGTNLKPQLFTYFFIMKNKSWHLVRNVPCNPRKWLFFFSSWKGQISIGGLSYLHHTHGNGSTSSSLV